MAHERRRKKIDSKNNKWNRLSIDQAILNAMVNPQTYFVFGIEVALQHTLTHSLMNMHWILCAKYFVLYQRLKLRQYFVLVVYAGFILVGLFIWALCRRANSLGIFLQQKIKCVSLLKEKWLMLKTISVWPFNSNILHLSNHLFIFAIFVLWSSSPLQKHKLQLK